jgi:DNA (cytosine-5)-methyltransferase 1
MKAGKQLKLNSFFAGIGGFDLGFERAGAAVSYHCEIDKFCQTILAKHWPDVPSSSNITEIDASTIPDAEIWSGGFPCQDVSVARGWLGRDGLKGKRSGLFHAFADLISQKLPKVVLLENVTGLLNSHDGYDFELVVRSLSKLGYGVSWRIMNSRYFGAPQSRPRVFVCAWHNDPIRAMQALYEDEISPAPQNERKGFLKPFICSVSGAQVPETAYCLAATSGRHTGTDWSRSYVAYHDRVRRLTPYECEGLQGFPSGWSIPSGLKCTQDEMDTLRYHALGNAVCVPVVEWVAKRVLTLWNNSTVGMSRSRKALESLLPSHKPHLVHAFDIPQEDKEGLKWSSGGYAWKDTCIHTTVSASPVIPIASRFIDIVETGHVPDRYFLSPNAAEGILRRVNSQGRTLFPPLHKALERLASIPPEIAKHESALPFDEFSVLSLSRA